MSHLHQGLVVLQLLYIVPHSLRVGLYVKLFAKRTLRKDPVPREKCQADVPVDQLVRLVSDALGEIQPFRIQSRSRSLPLSDGL